MTKLNLPIKVVRIATGNRTARASCAGMCVWGRRTTGMLKFALLATGIAACSADALAE